MEGTRAPGSAQSGSDWSSDSLIANKVDDRNSSDDCWIWDNRESIRSNSALHSTKLKIWVNDSSFWLIAVISG